MSARRPLIDCQPTSSCLGHLLYSHVCADSPVIACVALQVVSQGSHHWCLQAPGHQHTCNITPSRSDLRMSSMMDDRDPSQLSVAESAAGVRPGLLLWLVWRHLPPLHPHKPLHLHLLPQRCQQPSPACPKQHLADARGHSWSGTRWRSWRPSTRPKVGGWVVRGVLASPCSLDRTLGGLHKLEILHNYLPFSRITQAWNISFPNLLRSCAFFD